MVIRGNIKATYDASTQTWDVGEILNTLALKDLSDLQVLRVPKGILAQGVQVAAVVENELLLPAPPQLEDQFAIVDNTNTLYYSDGIEWYDPRFSYSRTTR